MREDQTVVFEEEEDEGRGVSQAFLLFIIYFLISCDQNIDGGSSAAELERPRNIVQYLSSVSVCVAMARPRPREYKAGDLVVRQDEGIPALAGEV